MQPAKADLLINDSTAGGLLCALGTSYLFQQLLGITNSPWTGLGGPICARASHRAPGMALALAVVHLQGRQQQ